MKLEKFPPVEGGWMTTHLSDMRKIYHFKGVNRLRTVVLRCDGAWQSKLDRASTWRAIFSGAKTLTLFPTMRDLTPNIDSGGVRASWERVGEHLQRAIEHEERAIKGQGRAIKQKARDAEADEAGIHAA